MAVTRRSLFLSASFPYRWYMIGQKDAGHAIWDAKSADASKGKARHGQGKDQDTKSAIKDKSPFLSPAPHSPWLIRPLPVQSLAGRFDSASDPDIPSPQPQLLLSTLSPATSSHKPPVISYPSRESSPADTFVSARSTLFESPHTASRRRDSLDFSDAGSDGGIFGFGGFEGWLTPRSTFDGSEDDDESNGIEQTFGTLPPLQLPLSIMSSATSEVHQEPAESLNMDPLSIPSILSPVESSPPLIITRPPVDISRLRRVTYEDQRSTSDSCKQAANIKARHTEIDHKWQEEPSPGCTVQ